MVRQRVFCSVLDAEETGHADFIERGMIGSKSSHHARLEQLEFTEWSEHLVDKLAVLVVVVKAESHYAARSGIVHQHGRNLLQLILVRFDVLFRTDEAFFFPTEEDEANRSFGPEIQLGKRARRLQNHHRARAVVRGARA